MGKSYKNISNTLDQNNKNTHLSRSPNFEILRVLAMLFIVFWHFNIHGIMHNLSGKAIFVIYKSPISYINYFLSEYIMIICSISVNCYVLISGYFLVKIPFKFNRITKIWFQTLFYSIIICITFHIFMPNTIGIKEIMKSCTPIRSNEYWFITKYLGMIALSPLLSKIAIVITKKEYKILLLILSILNITFYSNIPFGNIYGGPNSLMWFIFLFFVAGYIRLYKFSLPKWNYGILFTLFSFIIFLTIISKALIEVIILKNNISYMGISYNGLCFFLSLFLFLWFQKHNFKKNIINDLIVKIAPYTLGIYLIHDNRYMRSFLWYSGIDFDKYLNSSLLIPLMFSFSIPIFLACAFIDFIRSKIFIYLQINTLIDFTNSRLEKFSKKIFLIIDKNT